MTYNDIDNVCAGSTNFTTSPSVWGSLHLLIIACVIGLAFFAITSKIVILSSKF